MPAPFCTGVHYAPLAVVMTFYVRKFPGPCDPRTPCMGGEELNGFLTPPALMYIPQFPPLSPISRWTYDGPKGGLQLMPVVTLPFITAADVPRFVIWFINTTITLGGNDFQFGVRIQKKASSIPLVVPYDSYWVDMSIDGLPSDQEREYFPGSTTIYTQYDSFLPNPNWTWVNSGLPTQRVSSAILFPMAWDRVLPGPPFP